MSDTALDVNLISPSDSSLLARRFVSLASIGETERKIAEYHSTTDFLDATVGEPIYWRGK